MAVDIAPHLSQYNVSAESYINSLDSSDDSKLGRIVIGAAISASGTDVLIVQRTPWEKAFPSQWELPGGHSDPGETILDTVVREVKEETGLDVVSIADEFMSFEYISPEKDGGSAKTKQLNFIVRVDESHRNSVRLAPDEHQDYAWCTLQDIAKFGMTREMHQVVMDALRSVTSLKVNER